MFRRFMRLLVAMVVGASLWYGLGLAWAGVDGRGAKSPPRSNSRAWPWNYPSYRGYVEPSAMSAEFGPWGQPQKYQLNVNALPADYKVDPNKATIVAHVPENAAIWFEGSPTNAKGTLREFLSPPLDPKSRYSYNVRVAWVENGNLVSQTQTFTVAAGVIHCVYLMQTKATLEDKDAAAANLAKLNTEDRMLAQKQRFCAVQQEIKLGAMGVPVRVVLQGEPVFLCCEACPARAKQNAEATLARAKGLKSKADSGDAK